MWLKYSHEHITAEALVDREQPTRISEYAKPRGFWITDNTENCWRSWCISECFGLNALTHKHKVTLDESNICFLRSEVDIDLFTQEFQAWPLEPRSSLYRCVDWCKVAEKYTGLIITPYQWTRRLHEGCDWYYIWDCASGVIWKASAVLDIRLIEIDDEVAKERKSEAA